jgi:hypothetical protein
MADKPLKPLKSLNGKKFEGALAEPIDTGMFMPIRPDDPAWPQYLQAHAMMMSTQRMAKMPALARHLGIDVDHYNLSDPSNGLGLLMLCGSIAQELAGRVVPGFQEKPRGKNPREVVAFIRMAVDAMKAGGKASSDHEACKSFLKFETPDLARPGNRTELNKRARSLANLIAKDRTTAAKAEKALHKKPRLSVVK